MRTTVDLTDTQRAALLARAVERHLRGYSLLVQEAIVQYLKLPVERSSAPKRKVGPKSKEGQRLLHFFLDGYKTGRSDGSMAHDDYIYRRQ